MVEDAFLRLALRKGLHDAIRLPFSHTWIDSELERLRGSSVQLLRRCASDAYVVAHQ